MSFLAILANVLAVAALVGYIWLVVVAFKHSPLWGILVLLLSPFAAIIFAIKNWEDSKRPFLVYIGTSCSAFAIGIYLVFYVASPMLAMVNEASQGGEMDPEKVARSMNTIMDRMEEVGDLDAEDKAELDKMRRMINEDIAGKGNSDAQADDVSVEDLLVPAIESNGPKASSRSRRADATPADKSVAIDFARTITRDGYYSIPLTEAGEHLGEVVRVLEKGGRELTGKLKAAHGEGLTLEKSFVTGTFAIEVSSQDVETLQVYTR